MVLRQPLRNPLRRCFVADVYSSQGHSPIGRSSDSGAPERQRVAETECETATMAPNCCRQRGRVR